MQMLNPYGIFGLNTDIVASLCLINLLLPFNKDGQLVTLFPVRARDKIFHFTFHVGAVLRNCLRLKAEEAATLTVGEQRLNTRLRFLGEIMKLLGCKTNFSALRQVA